MNEKKILIKIKLHLLKKLYIWWINLGTGRELRGTETDEKIWKLLITKKN